ncbi:hypothetical protein CDAR_522721 [Caerostris darwini]|uniref:Transcriptional regulator n=1 Tax=Caerostris darwini TaxID=1538125 RepID=A0AAV4PTR8_9ARAC|nr:hypothetical protein CDAR_522721 [Caerostris darwini]
MKKKKKSGTLETAEIYRAEVYLIEKIQEQEFTSEIRNFRRKGCIQPSKGDAFRDYDVVSDIEMFYSHTKEIYSAQKEMC